MDFVKENKVINDQAIENDFRKFILKNDHPCVMAKALFKMGNYHLKTYPSMGEDASLVKLLMDLEGYIGQYDFNSNVFQSFIAVFPNESFQTEIGFEKTLWKMLQNLHELDDYEWDKSVSKDPESSNFSFSLKGKAFYIVGLHPNGSRKARQSPYPAVVFNLHWQFERLRKIGGFLRVKKRIRKRDKDLQGYINPTLRDFGEDSETKQYSGRQVEAGWKCPFNHKNK